MAALATDDFNRADAANLGANWTQGGGAGTRFTLTSNTAAQNAGTPPSIDFYNAVVWPANQYAKCTIAVLDTLADSGPGPAVRISSSALTLYFAQCNTADPRLYKSVAGTFTQLGSTAA